MDAHDAIKVERDNLRIEIQKYAQESGRLDGQLEEVKAALQRTQANQEVS